MLFNNNEIIRGNFDYMIGAVETTEDKVSYLQYMLAVENRILVLIVHALKDNMGYGVSKKQSIKDLLTFIYSKLSVLGKKYPTDEEGVLREIMNSEEFEKWKYRVWFRFQNTHLGVVNKETPIPAHSKLHPDINMDTVELIEKEDSLQVVIDGLAGLNFID